MRLPSKVRRTTWCPPSFGSSAPLDEDDESRATIIEVSHPKSVESRDLGSRILSVETGAPSETT